MFAIHTENAVGKAYAESCQNIKKVCGKTGQKDSALDCALQFVTWFPKPDPHVFHSVAKKHRHRT